LESYKEIEQTATSTVLPQMRMQKEELLSKFAAAEAAFRSIQTLLSNATATRLHVSSSTSVEISEVLQTLVTAYDSVNLIYKDILFLYDSNVTFLNLVISSNLSFAADTTFQQRASQTLQELSTIKNTAQTTLSKLETYVSNARKTLSDTIAAENAKIARLAAEKALAEKLAAEKLAAEKATADRLVAERLAAERLLKERLAAEKAKAEQLAAERLSAENYTRRIRNLEKEQTVLREAKMREILKKDDRLGNPTMGNTLKIILIVLIILFMMILLAIHFGLL
jgi:hypothetical protein